MSPIRNIHRSLELNVCTLVIGHRRHAVAHAYFDCLLSWHRRMQPQNIRPHENIAVCTIGLLSNNLGGIRNLEDGNGRWDKYQSVRWSLTRSNISQKKKARDYFAGPICFSRRCNFCMNQKRYTSSEKVHYDRRNIDGLKILLLTSKA